MNHVTLHRKSKVLSYFWRSFGEVGTCPMMQRCTSGSMVTSSVREWSTLRRGCASGVWDRWSFVAVIWRWVQRWTRAGRWWALPCLPLGKVVSPDVMIFLSSHLCLMPSICDNGFPFWQIDNLYTEGHVVAVLLHSSFRRISSFWSPYYAIQINALSIEVFIERYN